MSQSSKHRMIDLTKPVLRHASMTPDEIEQDLRAKGYRPIWDTSIFRFVDTFDSYPAEEGYAR